MQRSLMVRIALVVAIVGLYTQAHDHAFVDFDDQVYVTENAMVQQGLTAESIHFAFFENYANLWHPLTWISLMANVEAGGADEARGFLLTNIALHALNTLLLLSALLALTGRFWPSALTAAVFAVHPLQVEAVAWVSARKEVLAGFFLMLTLWSYALYARRGGASRYALVMLAFALCLGSKSAHASLPLLLLLLDFWPLERLRTGTRGDGESSFRLVLEKLPLLAVAGAAVGVGLVFAADLNNPWVTDPPFGERAAQAIVHYVQTLERIVWPAQLAITYPTPQQMGLPPWSLLHVGGALLFLLALTGTALSFARRRPYVALGWLWFLGMLLPMVGLIPAGLRVMHDRYTYIPIIGIALAFSFGVDEAARRFRAGRAGIARFAPVALVTALLGAYCLLSVRQVGVWRDSMTLFDHAIAINDRNAIILVGRGNLLGMKGDLPNARVAFEAALAIHPDYPAANNSLGYLLFQQRKVYEAIPYLRRAVALRPDWPVALSNVGNALMATGRYDEGLETLRSAVRAAPESATTHYWLAAALHHVRRWDEARDAYDAALAVDPENVWALKGLAQLDASHPRKE